jgi:hypothetical protein
MSNAIVAAADFNRIHHEDLTRIRQVWIIRGHCGPGQSNPTGCPAGMAGTAL